MTTFSKSFFVLIAKNIPLYSNIWKKYLLCLHEKLEIINYPQPDQLINKISELISKCCLAKIFLLRNSIIKESVNQNSLIGKEQGIRFYIEMFVIASLMCLKIVKYMKFKVTKKLLYIFIHVVTNSYSGVMTQVLSYLAIKQNLSLISSESSLVLSDSRQSNVQLSRSYCGQIFQSIEIMTNYRKWNYY